MGTNLDEAEWQGMGEGGGTDEAANDAEAVEEGDRGIHKRQYEAHAFCAFCSALHSTNESSIEGPA